MTYPKAHASLAFALALLLAASPCTGGTPHPDFIIVGGGTAGCTIAARLCTQLPQATIHLLERGQPRNATEEFLVRSARNTFQAWTKPSLTEAILAEPNAGLNGRAIVALTGNTLGGSSSINVGQWTLPPTGTIPSWGFRGLDDRRVRQLFRRAFDTVGAGVPPRELRQSYIVQWLRAAERVGLPRIFTPFRDGGRRGVWPNRISFDDAGRRRDACTAYVTPALAGACAGRLLVLQDARVDQILLRGRGAARRATGVRVRRNGRMVTMRASVETIVAAGPYGSPKLLQLSGIGPRAVLRAAGVRVRHELPVGINAQGRPVGFVVSAYAGVPIAPSNVAANLMAETAVRQFERGEGGVLGVAAAGSNGAIAEGELIASVTSARALQDIPLISSLCFLNGASRGSVTIRDARAETPARLEKDFLGGPGDLERMSRCVMQLRGVHRELEGPLGAQEVTIAPELPTPVLAEELVGTELPVAALEDPAVFEAYLKATADDSYHFVGGCSIGEVVDEDFAVRGIRGLRVVDASVIPRIPTSAGPMASVYIVAEHAAEIIAQKHPELRRL